MSRHDTPTTPASISTRREGEVARRLAPGQGLVAGLVAATAAAARPPSDGAGPEVDHLGRAVSFIGQGEDGRAVYHLRRQLESLPEDTHARRLLAGAYARLGLSRAALSQVQLVLAEAPDDVVALGTLARLQAEAAHHDDALRTIGRIRQLGGADESIDTLEARELFRTGRHEEALEPLRLAVARHPGDAELLGLCALSSLRVGGKENARVARELLRQAAALRPGDATLHNSLGFAHERLGELEDAYLEYVEAENLSGGEASYARNRQRVEAVLAGR
jgi:Flp pilus assembly protein TadD